MFTIMMIIGRIKGIPYGFSEFFLALVIDLGFLVLWIL